MNFLNPLAIAVAAGLTVPPLVALYFLKLKRTARPVPSTLLWRRSVEDLQVNAPFQRLRRSLLLLLQLLVLALAAMALGKPMFQAVEVTDGTVLLLIDNSASMSVREADGRTRLDQAREQARRTVDTLSDDARAMIIAFSDRGEVISSFESDKASLKRQIDSIEPTDSATTLAEAIGLAESYSRNLLIGGDQPGTDVAPESAAPPATVFIFTDGKIEDADTVALERIDPSRMRVINVGKRRDNVGIIAMDARRNYESPEYLQVSAAVQNFDDRPVTVDAVLYVDGQNVDIQTVELGAAPAADAPTGSEPAAEDRTATGVAVAAFDRIVFEGGGLVEVVLRVDDALPADDRAWTVIDPPRRARLLLVTPGNSFLENVLATLAADVEVMSPSAYESADESALVVEGRSPFDVVIVDRHSTGRLPQGSYLFWAGVPEIEGVSAGGVIDHEIIFDWDQSHPILRYVAVQTINPVMWLELTFPPEAIEIVEGERTPVIAYLARDASQYLISALSVIGEDAHGRLFRNGDWVASMDFVVLVQNMVQFLASNIAVRGDRSLTPGEPLTASVPGGVESVRVRRPDGVVDEIPGAGHNTVHYARTRTVGAYRIEPGLPGQDVFAVNLFNPAESDVAPADAVNIAAASIATRASNIEVSQPAWPYFVLGLLAVLLLEWAVYNRRAFV